MLFQNQHTVTMKDLSAPVNHISGFRVTGAGTVIPRFTFKRPDTGKNHDRVRSMLKVSGRHLPRENHGPKVTGKETATIIIAHGTMEIAKLIS